MRINNTNLITLLCQVSLLCLQLFHFLFPHVDFVLDVGAPRCTSHIFVIGSHHTHKLQVLGANASAPFRVVELDKTVVFDFFQAQRSPVEQNQEARVVAEKRCEKR